MWIELTRVWPNGGTRPVVVNTDNITFFTPNVEGGVSMGTALWMVDNDYYKVTEPYEQVRRRILGIASEEFQWQIPLEVAMASE